MYESVREKWNMVIINLVLMRNKSGLKPDLTGV